MAWTPRSSAVMKQKGILVEPKEFDFFVENLPDEMEYKAAVKTEVQ